MNSHCSIYSNAEVMEMKMRDALDSCDHHNTITDSTRLLNRAGVSGPFKQVYPYLTSLSKCQMCHHYSGEFPEILPKEK